jgi:hypothetical protein
MPNLTQSKNPTKSKVIVHFWYSIKKYLAILINMSQITNIKVSGTCLIHEILIQIKDMGHFYDKFQNNLTCLLQNLIFHS